MPHTRLPRRACVLRRAAPAPQTRFKHVDTGFFLYSHDARFGNPIAGQFEVCAFGQKNKNGEWQAAEGVYLPRPKSEDGEDKDEL